MRELEAVQNLKKVARAVQDAPKSQRKEVMAQQMESLRIPTPFRLPINSRITATSLITSRCKVKDSFTVC
jgi:hypothetical protein